MLRPVDGPVIYTNVSVTGTAVELKVGATTQEERKVLMIQPKGNSIFIGYDNLVTSTNGVEVFKNQIMFIEAGDKVPVYAIASSGSIDVRIVEMS